MISVTKFGVVLFLFQVLNLVLFGFFVRYRSFDPTKIDQGVGFYYPFYQDVNVMLFMGFGFLMTFLRKYGYSAVSYNFLFSALSIQWATLTAAFFSKAYENDLSTYISVDIKSLIHADFTAATMMIAFGALLGKVSPLQFMVVIFFGCLAASVNEMIGSLDFKAVDMGGSMFVHTFGAYYGLGISYLASPYPQAIKDKYKNNAPSYTSDLFAMIGTIFLWMFWPSFNGALASDAAQHRVVINTVFALTASCVAAFLMSHLLRPHNNFDMVDIQNATLAGGVAVGSSADLVIEPWAAIVLGLIAGVLSVIGYIYISPLMEEHLGLHDTCGVHNLHGMPGILGGLAGTVSAAVASDDEYGLEIGKIFEARGGPNPRSASEQAGYQIAALGVTLAISITSGLIVGWIIRQKIFNPPNNKYLYTDEEYWELPTEVISKSLRTESSGSGLRAMADKQQAHAAAANGIGEAASAYQMDEIEYPTPAKTSL